MREDEKATRPVITKESPGIRSASSGGSVQRDLDVRIADRAHTVHGKRDLADHLLAGTDSAGRLSAEDLMELLTS